MKASAAPKTQKSAPFQRALLTWYSKNQRELPWRGCADPYRIWVSEVMLQQTRVAVVINYYTEFLRRFPTLEALAAAGEDQVLAVWSGLGYYRRARMLHLAAKHLVKRRAGNIPSSYAQLMQLPGIGRYTAAAIASIAYQEPVAVVDGNVERVILRLSGRPQSAGVDLWSEAQRLLDAKRPGDFNQAMMELGATVCLPQQPRCEECPARRFCRTQGEHITAARPQRRQSELHYALARQDGAVKLVQRGAGERLMAGMWELPSADKQDDEPLLRMRHAITVTDYQIMIHAAGKAQGKWIQLKEVGKLPLTGVTRKVLRALGLMN